MKGTSTPIIFYTTSNICQFLRNRKIPTMTDLYCLTFLDTFRAEKKMITFNRGKMLSFRSKVVTK